MLSVSLHLFVCVYLSGVKKQVGSAGSLSEYSLLSGGGDFLIIKREPDSPFLGTVTCVMTWRCQSTTDQKPTHSHTSHIYLCVLLIESVFL